MEILEVEDLADDRLELARVQPGYKLSIHLALDVGRIGISNGHSVSKAKYRMVTGRAWIAHRCNGQVGRRRGPTLDERTAYNGQAAGPTA